MTCSRTLSLGGALCALFVLSTLTAAQEPPAPPPAAAPAVEAPPAADTAPPAEPSAAPPPADTSCMPPCREGFMCNAGTCISACNPACPAGQRCTADAQCVADVAVLPPSYPVGPYAGGPAPIETMREPDPSRYRHDGFMLRATIGFGGAGMQETGSAFGDVDYAGGGMAMSVDLGGAVSDQLTVFGRLAMFTLVEPSWQNDGADGTLRDQNVSSGLIGGGVAYHLMPLNMYFALAAGLGFISISDVDDDEERAGDRNGSTEPGIALNLDVGKEWWVAPQVGLGAALRLWVGTGGFESDSGATDLDRSFGGAALLFSFTFQ